MKPSYDALQRLRTGGTTAAPESYSYDAEGNRTASQLSATYVTDTANRLLQDDTFAYTYDHNGNLASKTERATAKVTTYKHDAQDELVEIDQPDGSVVTYRYDAVGRWVERNPSLERSLATYDGEDILLHYDGAGVFQARYTQGDGTDQPLEFERGGQRYFYEANHLGSIRTVRNASGADNVQIVSHI